MGTAKRILGEEHSSFFFDSGKLGTPLYLVVLLYRDITMSIAYHSQVPYQQWMKHDAWKSSELPHFPLLLPPGRMATAGAAYVNRDTSPNSLR